jgi:hypothetical protein
LGLLRAVPVHVVVAGLAQRLEVVGEVTAAVLALDDVVRDHSRCAARNAPALGALECALAFALESTAAGSVTMLRAAAPAVGPAWAPWE